MENMGMISTFWSGKKVFITGHTGFKGSWLSLWLTEMGAEVDGFALQPPTNPSLFELINIKEQINSTIADVRDSECLAAALSNAQPQIVFHLAAQPLVRTSYKNPVETYGTNVMGTVHLLEAVRRCPSVKSVVIVTTDKCYENKEWAWGYRENDTLGGFDPYSSSKACAEMVAFAYRTSFFHPETYSLHGVAVATARAGNVIGGGDWADDRLVPDVMRALLADDIIRIRNPHAVRPWQHVLESLHGYLVLAQRLYEHGPGYAEAWNFGPQDDDAKPVGWLVQRMCQLWGNNARCKIEPETHLHETSYLKLDCSKTHEILGWHPRWRLDRALRSIIEWISEYRNGSDMKSVCLRQIEEFEQGSTAEDSP